MPAQVATSRPSRYVGRALLVAALIAVLPASPVGRRPARASWVGEHDCGAGRRLTYSGPQTIWPPSSLPVRVRVSATDDSGDVVRLATTVTHDEAQAATVAEAHVGYVTVKDVDPVYQAHIGGTGAASVEHDIQAARWSLGDGRTYAVDATAVFAGGATCRARFTSTVPVDEPVGRSVLPREWDLAHDPTVIRLFGRAHDDGTWRVEPSDGTGYALLFGTNGGMQGRVRLSLPVTLHGSPAANHELGSISVVDIQDANAIVAQADLYSHMYEQAGGTVVLSLPFDARPDHLYEIYIGATGRASLAFGKLAAAADEPTTLARRAGNDVLVAHATGEAQDRGWIAKPGVHLPGVLSDDPAVATTAGTRRAVVRLRTQDASGRTAALTQSPAPLATITVLSGGVPVASHQVHVEDFTGAGVPRDFGLDFVATPGLPVGVRVDWTGLAVLRHDETRIEDPQWAQRWDATSKRVHHTTGDGAGAVWRATPGAHRAGTVASGPFGPEAEHLFGTGQATYQLGIHGAHAPDTAVARIAVVQEGTELLARELRAGDFRHAGRMQDFRLAYAAAKGSPVRLVVTWHGGVPIDVSELRVEDRELSDRPGFAEVWDGAARIVTSEENPLGRNPSAHIADMQIVAVGSLYYAYYTTPDGTSRIKQRAQSGAIGLAVSSDGGRTFVPHRGGRPVVEAGVPGDFDSLYMVSPSVVRNGDELVMVYEGYGGVYGDTVDGVQRRLSPDAAGFPAGHGPPTLGWATSSDGITWTKRGPIPRELAWTSWESLGTGSPNLTLWNGTFRLWYTGFRYPDYSLARGFSSGPSLDQLTKEPANPVLMVGPRGSWDRGAIGRTSLSYDGEWYWVWYEGGLNPWCDESSRWGVGIARSRDLKNWERWGSNPIHVMPEAGACWSAFASSAVIDGARTPIWLSKQVHGMRDEIRAVPAAPTTP